MKNFVKTLIFSLGLVAGIAGTAHSQINFATQDDSVAYMRLQELRGKSIYEMTSAELNEYTNLKFSGLDAKYTVPNMLKAGSSSLCSNAISFCTDNDAYTYPAATTSTGATEFGNNGNNVGCLYTTPSPAWFVMRIDNPGNLLIYMEHSNGQDIDFICWGPFTASTKEELLDYYCTNISSRLNTNDNGNGNHRPTNGNHSGNMGGYPTGNMVDCSYDPADTEWCYLPNTQAGQWYIFLITNYSQAAGDITFEAQHPSWMTGSVATTDCNIIANLTVNSPVCEGSTLRLSCSTVNSATSYKWYYLGATRNETIGSGTLLGTGTTLSRANATPDMTGWYAMDISTNLRTNRFLTYAIVTPRPTVTLTASPSEVCAGQQVSLTANGTNITNYSWSVGGSGSTVTVTPGGTTTYYVTVSNTSSVSNPETGQSVSNTCYSYANTRVTVNPSPSVSIAPVEARVCTGNSVELTSEVQNCDGCTFAWSTGANVDDIGVSPTTTTTYTLTVTNSYGCTAVSNPSVVNVVNSSNIGECNVLYVSVAGGGSGLTAYEPTDLQTALTLAECSGATIRMEEGLYETDYPIELVSNVTLEGGYFNDFMQKKSNAGATTIRRTNTYTLGSVSAPRLVAIEADNISNFSLQDITVETEDAQNLKKKKISSEKGEQDGSDRKRENNKTDKTIN
jgi:hypothetical protein